MNKVGEIRMEYRAVTKEDPQKDLTHWKYIKRVKKNGKWRYYYDKEQLKDDLGFDERDALEKAKNNYLDVVGVNQDRVEDPLDTARYLQDSWDDLVKKTALKTDVHNKEQMDELMWMRSESNKMFKAKIGYEYAKRMYESTPLGFAEKTLNNGKEWIDNTFKKVSRKLGIH